MTELLVSIALFLLLLFLCVKGYMWGASLMVLLQGAISSLVIALIILFALPAGARVVGPNLPYIPISISAVLVVSAVLSIFFAQKSQNVASGTHNKVGITVFVLGVLLWAIGFTSFCLFIFGDLPGGPDPKAATITFSALIWGGAISLYFSTKYESVKFPNVYRWLSFWAATFMLSTISACSMIFLYAFPSKIPITVTFWASLNSFNFVPVALLFIGFNQNYVKKKLVNKVGSQYGDESNFTFE